MLEKLENLRKNYDEGIKKALKINSGDLRQELFHHPGIAYTWHCRGSEVKRSLERLMLERDILESELRKQFQKENPKTPTTTLKLKGTIFIQLHPDWQQINHRITAVAQIWDMLEGARWRFSERFRALINERTKQDEQEAQIWQMQKEMQDAQSKNSQTE